MSTTHPTDGAGRLSVKTAVRVSVPAVSGHTEGRGQSKRYRVKHPRRDRRLEEVGRYGRAEKAVVARAEPNCRGRGDRRAQPALPADGEQRIQPPADISRKGPCGPASCLLP